MAMLEEDEHLGDLDLGATSGCYGDALEALMKSLEDTLPSYCGSTEDELGYDVLSVVRARDKADSVSSELSSGLGSDGSSQGSSSCGEQEEGVKEEKVHGNNKKSDKSKAKKSTTKTETEDTSDEAPRHSMTMRKRAEKDYNLRNSSIINRIQTEERIKKPKQPKPKAAPPPLSKYRRRTANSRERNRMREINDAYEVLRLAIPSYPVEATGAKLTKITTLRMALNYIDALRGMLGYSENEPGPPIEQSSEVSCSTGSEPGNTEVPYSGNDLAGSHSTHDFDDVNNDNFTSSDMSMDMDLSHDQCFDDLLDDTVNESLTS